MDFWKAFAPFEPSLWFALLVALVLTVFLLWLFEGAKNDQFSRGGWGRRHRTATRGLSRSVYVTSSLMMSQLTHKPETLEGYLLTLGEGEGVNRDILSVFFFVLFLLCHPDCSSLWQFQNGRGRWGDTGYFLCENAFFFFFLIS